MISQAVAASHSLLSEGFGHLLPRGFVGLPPEQQAKEVIWALAVLRGLADGGDQDAERLLRQTRRAASYVTPLTRERRRRVGFLTPVLAFPGGVERWQLSLGEQLQRHGWDAGTAVMNHALADTRSVQAALMLGPVMLGRPGVQALAEWADVLIAWGAPDLAWWLPASYPPLVLVNHGHSPWSLSVIRGAKRACDRVVSVSEHAAEAIPESVVIPNGVDVRRIVLDEEQRAAARIKWRRQWGVSDRQTVVGYVGRVVVDKRPEAVAEACGVLGSEYVPVIVGMSEHSEGEKVRRAVRRHRADTRFSEAVERVGEVLAGIDVLLCCSQHEGFGLVLAEAWAAGVPTVSTRVGIVDEAERRFGRLTVSVSQTATAAELAEAVRVAQQGENVERARRAVQGSYTVEQCGDAWHELLLGLLQVAPQVVHDPVLAQ